MEQTTPALQLHVEKLRSHIYHWSHVADLTYQAFGVSVLSRQTAGDADKPGVVYTVLRTKNIDRYISKSERRQKIIDDILDATFLPLEAEAMFDWADYADFIGDVVDYFDEALERGDYYDPISVA